MRHQLGHRLRSNFGFGLKEDQFLRRCRVRQFQEVSRVIWFRLLLGVDRLR